MSSNAVAAMAVILVSGFAGCAATARASETAPASVTITVDRAAARVDVRATAAHAPMLAALPRATR